jgi:putative ABC transport system substrate-binding protein
MNLKSKIQNRKLVGIAVAGITFTMCGVLAQAQQQVKVTKIGWLGIRPATGEAIEGRGNVVTRRMLRELGYVEGKNIAFEFRSADYKLDRLPALANELVRLKVDLIITSTLSAALVAKNATRTIPIVFLGTGDPAAAGLVDSLPRPGGNVTGFTTRAQVLAGKRLELLKETIPNLFRVAVLWEPQNSISAQSWKESQFSARELGLQLHSMDVGSAEKYEAAFKEAIKTGSAALVVIQSPLAAANQKQIAALAVQSRLPSISARADYVENGGLMSYGPDRTEPYRRLAAMVDKILKGTKPADLPVEQPTKFELVINLKTAKALGLTIPPVVMMRAEKVIR